MKTIVSLTSFPPAIRYAADAVRSILAGAVLPDKIVLYLAETQFPGRKVPEELAAVERESPLFEVRWCPDDDIRSYKKLIPALADFPEEIIVTVDDDVWYHRNMLRDLMRIHNRRPDVIVAHRARRARLGKPYKSWRKYRWYDFIFRRMHFDWRTLPTGVGGVLYPPHSLDETMLDPEVFMALAPTVDDIWFWTAAVSGGTYVVPYPWGVHNKTRGLEKPVALSLKKLNVMSGEDRNVVALKKILERYPAVAKKLSV